MKKSIEFRFWHPQYLADQLTLIPTREGRFCPPFLLLAPKKLFIFRHPCNCKWYNSVEIWDTYTSFCWVLIGVYEEPQVLNHGENLVATSAMVGRICPPLVGIGLGIWKFRCDRGRIGCPCGYIPQKHNRSSDYLIWRLGFQALSIL